MDPAYLIIGFIVGFLIGLGGVGGGVVLTPLLIFTGVSPVYAVGSSLVYASLTKSLGSFLHYKKNNVDLSTVKILLIGSIPASFLGFLILKYLKSNFNIQYLNATVSILLAFVLILISLMLFSQIFLVEGIKLKNPSKMLLVLASFIVGITIQLTSVGSGVIITLFLLPFLIPRRVVGTSVFYAFILTGVAGLMHFSIGNVLPNLVLLLLSGSIPGIIIGVNFSTKIPTKPYYAILTLLIFFAGLILIHKNFVFLLEITNY